MIRRAPAVTSRSKVWAAPASVLLEADNTGLVNPKSYTGSSTDVLAGDGTFASIGTLEDVDWVQVISGNRPTSLGDWMYTNGNIGINFGSTVNPYAALHVQTNIYAGDDNMSGFFNSNAIAHLARNDAPNLLLEDIGHNTGGISLDAAGLHIAAENADIEFKTGVSSTGDYGDNSNGSRRLVIQSDGDVGIGTATPSSALEVNGQVTITGGSPGDGKVLTSNGSGLGSWQDPARNISVASNMAYSFDDVAWTTGTSGDDAISGAIGLGFTLHIFGTGYTTAYLGTNGYIKFGEGSYMTSANGCLPSATINSSAAALLFWWDDLICNSFQYRTVGTAPNRVFQARYDGYQYNAAGEIVDVMIMIHEGSDLMVVRYDDVGCCSDDAKGGGATFGLQGSGGSSADTVPLGCDTPLADDNQGANASQFWSVRAPE